MWNLELLDGADQTRKRSRSRYTHIFVSFSLTQTSVDWPNKPKSTSLLNFVTKLCVTTKKAYLMSNYVFYSKNLEKKKAVVDSRRERVFHKIACLSDFDETEKFLISDYFFGLSITTETLERDKSIKFFTSWRFLHAKFNLFYISCR